MATLKEASEQITGRLEELVGELRTELSDGDVDFERLGSIADQISERADHLAETFTSVNEALMSRLQGGGGSDGGDGDGDGEGNGSRSRQRAGSSGRSGSKARSSG
jgi:hypothetical protein